MDGTFVLLPALQANQPLTSCIKPYLQMTREYPHAFMVPAFDMGHSYNASTYMIFENIMWRATSGQINKWRTSYLHLPRTSLSQMAISEVPFLYNFSPSVVPKPLDWVDNATITGYWFLETSDADWIPPPDLEEWIAKARLDGKAIVYLVNLADFRKISLSSKTGFRFNCSVSSGCSHQRDY